MFILANPLVYLLVGSLVVDIRNLFGADIVRQSVSYSTEDPFIIGMYVVAAAGFLFMIIGALRQDRMPRVRSSSN